MHWSVWDNSYGFQTLKNWNSKLNLVLLTFEVCHRILTIKPHPIRNWEYSSRLTSPLSWHRGHWPNESTCLEDADHNDADYNQHWSYSMDGIHRMIFNEQKVLDSSVELQNLNNFDSKLLMKATSPKVLLNIWVQIRQLLNSSKIRIVPFEPCPHVVCLQRISSRIAILNWEFRLAIFVTISVTIGLT